MGTNGSSGNIAGGVGAPGYIRVEAYNYSGFNPSASPSFVSFALPSPAVVTNAPRLRITSVAGSAAPATPVGSLYGAPDIVVPLTQPNPVAVNIEGNNIPLATVVQITVIPATGTRTTFNSGGLAGTVATSTAAANVTLPSGMSVLTATVIIDQFASVRPMFIEGERVKQIEVAATYGGESEVTYITSSGRRIKASGE